MNQCSLAVECRLCTLVTDSEDNLKIEGFCFVALVLPARDALERLKVTLEEWRAPCLLLLRFSFGKGPSRTERSRRMGG